MKQTEREQKRAQATKETAAENGRRESKESGAAQQPRSWRKYIEETEQAEKQAELNAAKAQQQPVKSKKGKKSSRRRPAEARQEEAKTAALLPAVREEQPKEDPLKAQAAKAAKAQAAKAAKGLNAGWERVCDFTADSWERVAQAVGKVRAVVDRHPISPLFYVTLLVLVLGYNAFNGRYIRAYALNVDGQELGVVSGQEDVDAIVNSIETRASDVLGERYDYAAEISTTPVFATPDELIDTTQVADALFDGVGAYIQAYELRVNGGLLGYAADSADLYQLLDEVAQPYLTPDTVSYEFVEEVEVLPVQLPSNTRFNLETIRDVLHTMQVEEAVYVVQKGDTFNAIAYSLDMWPNELSVLNPDIIVDKLWVGQELVIQEAVPYLSVEMVTDETYEEIIHSPVEYIETADLYVGNTKVKEQGEDGLALVNAHVTYVNGVEMGREVVESTTLKEATTTYTYTGTTPRPATASNGYYIWPVRGTITSNFGSRTLWGSYDFHLGLDIACPMNTGIKAADGGTVIKAGWSGSYGNLVAIRHDNGTVTYYAHNNSILVSVGQKVYQGQIIAKAGMTGNASGPHCHFEVRINGTSVNPRNYLR